MRIIVVNKRGATSLIDGYREVCDSGFLHTYFREVNLRKDLVGMAAPTGEKNENLSKTMHDIAREKGLDFFEVREERALNIRKLLKDRMKKNEQGN